MILVADNGILGIGLAGLAQAIPLPVSVILSAFVVGYQVRSVLGVEDRGRLKITKHLLLLLLTWTALSILAGLYLSFEMIEADQNVGLLEGFAYGLRFGFLMVPVGFGVLCGPFLIWMKSGRQTRSS